MTCSFQKLWLVTFTVHCDILILPFTQLDITESILSDTPTFVALYAGFVAIEVTVAIEKFGGLVGGVLGSTPIMILPAAFRIAVHAPTQQEFKKPMLSVPVGVLLTAGFLLLWKHVPPKLPGKFFIVKNILQFLMFFQHSFRCPTSHP